MGDITLVGAGHIVLGAGLSYDILLHKTRPVSAVLWLAVVWVVPYVGALAYVSFGIDRVRRGAAEREVSRSLVAGRAVLLPSFERFIVDPSRPDGWPGDDDGRRIFRGTDPAVRRNRVLRGNRAELLVDGDEFYPALFDVIRRADDSIHLQTFIFGRGETGTSLRDLLMDRAREGLEVRLLYDRFGSTWTHFSDFFDPAREAGVMVHSISQANPLKGRFQINLRNHRKLAVVDGRIGFVGGINFHDRNVSGSGDGRAIRDYHVKLEGPAVSDLQAQFVEDWIFATGGRPDPLMGSDYFPEPRSAGDALVQIVPGGPEMEGGGLADVYFGAIVAAERSISVVTAYFVPDEPLYQALRFAALRGVDVRLVVPGKSNHRYTEYAARSLYAPLLESGVRIFERGPPFMHAKALVVDGCYALLGSANLDYRSLHLNFETNLEVVDAEFVDSLSRQIESEVAASEEIDRETHASRSLPRRLLENFCRLFQPML